MPHPTSVYNGGDPAGLVQHIHWTGWGKSMAVGSGSSVYDWPGTTSANNTATPGARIVAFHLGTCLGRPSYNAVEWYFPKYDQTFEPNQYINACTGKYVGSYPKAVSCPNVSLLNGNTATQVQVIHMSCAKASGLIAHAPVAGYLRPGDGRFVQSGFRCGTQGTGGGLPPIFDCQLGSEEFLYSVA